MAHTCPKCKKAFLQYRQRVIETWSYNGDPLAVEFDTLLSSVPEPSSGWFECPLCAAHIEQMALSDLLEGGEIDFSPWSKLLGNKNGLVYMRKLADEFYQGTLPIAQFEFSAADLVGVCVMLRLGVTWIRIQETVQKPAPRIRARYFSFMRFVGTRFSGSVEEIKADGLLDSLLPGLDLDRILGRKTPHADKYGMLVTEILLS